MSDIEQLLQVLQAEAAVKGQEWLQSQLQGKDINELRKLSTHFGLSHRAADSLRKLSKAELVHQLLQAISPSLDPWLPVCETT